MSRYNHYKHLLNNNVAQVNIGWFNNDSVNGTTEVLGSVNQYQAPIEVLIDMTVSTTEIRIFVNQIVEISVSMKNKLTAPSDS